jgi:hypothetical protein
MVSSYGSFSTSVGTIDLSLTTPIYENQSVLVSYDSITGNIQGKATSVPLATFTSGAGDISNLSTVSSPNSGSVISNPPIPPQQTPAEVVRAPYTGPVVTTPQITGAVAGGKLTIPGDNLSSVSRVSIDGLDATVTVNSDGELEITVPAGLAAGTYDLVIVSDAGRLTVQNAIVVSGSAAITSTGDARPSTKRLVDDSVKVWVFDVVDAGKVQIFVNDKEIAWVNATDVDDSKLFSGYLVRTVNLAAGKNVIEVYVNGVRVDRKAYTR